MSNASRGLIIEVDPNFEQTMINNLRIIDGSNAMKSKIVRAMYRSANRALSGANTLASKYATKRYQISSGDFKSNLKYTKPQKTESSDGISFTIKFRGSVIPLVNFGFKVGNKGNGHAVIRAKILKGGGWASVRNGFLNYKYGRVRTMARFGNRNEIKEEWGPTTASMVYADEVKEPMLDKFEEVYHNRLVHELDRVLLFTGLT